MSTLYPRAWCNDQRLHPCSGIVALLFAEAGVNHVDDAVYGE